VLHQVGVSFDLYYDARKHKIKKKIMWTYLILRSIQRGTFLKVRDALCKVAVILVSV
jgi:hypothetical protein